MYVIPWQQPNATEAYAADSLKGISGYMPFPWATWIDRARRGYPPEFPELNCPSTHGPRVTVCQHIWALEHLDLFRRAGITDLFWSHAVQGLAQINGIRLHPFPLYPVRCATHPPSVPPLPPTQRPLLYSFQGAYAPELYLTPVRHWLLNLPPRPDAQLERRQEWHYEQAVYREQVEEQPADPLRHAQLNTEANAYATTLQHSCFALCPSGSGPNSIRLWEALGYGAIPVILSDQLQLPGTAPLWEAAALFVPETQAAVAALPSQLEALAADPERLRAMQQAGQTIWRRYGLPGFAKDIEAFLRDPLAVLQMRGIQGLPQSEPLVVHASQPAELPLKLLRELRHQSTQRAVLIQINDNSPRELAILRWKPALQLCKQQLKGRTAAVTCVVPELEEMLHQESPQTRREVIKISGLQHPHMKTQKSFSKEGDNKIAANEIVFIYQPGKVGSSTVNSILLQNLNPKYIVQLHFLSQAFKKRATGITTYKWHIEQINKAEKLREEHPENRIKIISLVRDPVSRNMSDFFQNPANYLEKGQKLGDLSEEDAIKTFKRKNNYDYILNWFKKEFEAYTGIDIFNHQFDQKKGYSIFSEKNYDILIIKMEDLKKCLNSALKEFLDLDIYNKSTQVNSKLENRNNSDLYIQFKSQISFSRHELHEVYSSKYAQHFYGDDIDKLIEKWGTGFRS